MKNYICIWYKNSSLKYFTFQTALTPFWRFVLPELFRHKIEIFLVLQWKLFHLFLNQLFTGELSEKNEIVKFFMHRYFYEKINQSVAFHISIIVGLKNKRNDINSKKMVESPTQKLKITLTVRKIRKFFVCFSLGSYLNLN